MSTMTVVSGPASEMATAFDGAQAESMTPKAADACSMSAAMPVGRRSAFAGEKRAQTDRGGRESV